MRPFSIWKFFFPRRKSAENSLRKRTTKGLVYKNGRFLLPLHFLFPPEQNKPVDVTGATQPGLPDGLFSNQKSQFGSILEGLRLENVDMFYGHFEYFTDIWDILWPFGTFCFYLVHFVSI
jgi:hypothetical protein